jgi:hypothetical protein
MFLDLISAWGLLSGVVFGTDLDLEDLPPDPGAAMS